MRILIFAPNIGASLSIGGGNNFVVKQAALLSSELGQEVVLAGFHAFSLPELVRAHGLWLDPQRVRVVSGGGSLGFRLFRSFPLKLLAYNVLVSPRYRRWVDRTIRRVDPELVWFHDDIPSCAVPALNGRRTLLYVHYPLLGRTVEVCPPIAHTRGLVERLNDALLQSVLRGSLVARPEEVAEEVWANSTVTRRAIQKVWGTRHERTVFTYVPPTELVREKEKVIMAAGAFSKGKNYEALLQAFAGAGLEDWQLHLFGAARDAGYLARLERQVEDHRMKGRIEMHPDAPRADVLEAFARASIVLQGGEFEPFGLSMLEGMAHGDLPVAFRSEFSGSWLDVLGSGRWGSGFSTADELAAELHRLAEVQRSESSALAFERSQQFSREALKEELGRTL
ncbi:MAG: glycosyltransferase [Thermoplasmata archaeon]|nr:glycosyltransferase [Thermoplasmata archaeon]